MSISGLSSSTSTYATAQSGRNAGAAESQSSAQESTGTTTLSVAELEQISKLKSRDAEVRQHEQAHLAAAGGLAVSGASYTYQKGPDGVSYAIGGEVGINVSPGRTPEETLARASTVEAAALAPAEPSGADRAIAAQARQMALEARTELAQKQPDEQASGKADSPGSRISDVYNAIDKASVLATQVNTYA